MPSDKQSHYGVDATTKIKKRLQDAHGDVKKIKREDNDKAEKETYEVLQAGQLDPTKAAPHVAAQAEADKKEQEDTADKIKDELERNKRSFIGYMQTLAKGLAEVLQMLDWVRGWKADVLVTKGGPISIYGKPFQSQEGILLVVKTPDGRVFHQGMKVTQEPMLDYAGIYTLALQVENTMDSERGLLLDGKSLDGHDGDGSGILDAHGNRLRTTTSGANQQNGQAVRGHAGSKKAGGTA